MESIATMSIDYNLENGLVVFTADGFSPYEEIISVFDSLSRDPSVTTPLKIIIDTRQTDYAPPSNEIESLIEYLGKITIYLGSRWAIVAPRNSLQFGVGRMFGALVEGSGICSETFSDIDAARSWLLQSKNQTD